MNTSFINLQQALDDMGKVHDVLFVVRGLSAIHMVSTEGFFDESGKMVALDDETIDELSSMDVHVELNFHDLPVMFSPNWCVLVFLGKEINDENPYVAAMFNDIHDVISYYLSTSHRLAHHKIRTAFLGDNEFTQVMVDNGFPPADYDPGKSKSGSNTGDNDDDDDDDDDNDDDDDRSDDERHLDIMVAHYQAAYKKNGKAH